MRKLRRRWISFSGAFILLLTLMALAFLPEASGLDLLSQFPTFHSHCVRTGDPLSLIFDHSLDPGSVDAESIHVTRIGTGEPVPGDLSVKNTRLADDTVIFTPEGGWEWGVRYRLEITSTLESASGDPFTGELADHGIFAANIPNDFQVPVWDPSNPSSLSVETVALIGFDPIDPEAEAMPWQIPGSNVTGAWKYTVGRPDVIIALVDDGIVDYGDPEIRRAILLNPGELPVPNVNGKPCASYDCNGDGRFDVDDYSHDSRLGTSRPISPDDLIHAFSDGVDNDGNGLVDDIAGWDFFRGANEALGIQEVPVVGTHGDGQAKWIVSQGNNGIGIRPGICPECRLLPIRASANIVYDYGMLAAAVRYAVSMGASVIHLAGVNFTWSEQAHRAFLDALDAGALTVAASGDEMTFHHWMPAAGEDVLSVKTIFPFVTTAPGHAGLDKIAFTETFCTNYGSHIHVTVPAASFCTSEGTANVAGVAGLLFSYGRDQGLNLEPDEVKQLLTMTAYDIKDRCASISNLCGVCQPGYDEHFGYGKVDAEAAMLAIGDRDLGIGPAIPPSVRITEPTWWQTVDPIQTPSLAVQGVIHSRVLPYTWRLQVAKGYEPLEEAFITVATGSEEGPREGLISTVPVHEIFSDEWATGVPATLHSFEVTLRLQASYDSASRGTVTGEARKTVSVHIDNDVHTGLVPGFPLWLGASGESSPLLYDLDGDKDHRLEIVFGTGAGSVVALKYDPADATWKNMPGFPVDLSGSGSWVKDTIFASVAVGDLLGDGSPKIVAATTGGKIYAIDPVKAAQGDPFLPGFPVSSDPADTSTSLAFFHGNGFMASPVLADLDLDGMLEIVAASMDQKVYAWKPVGVSGGVERLAGWPVLCRSISGMVPPESVCQGSGLPSPILGTPAIGILDPQTPDQHISGYPAVVVATNEACDSSSVPETRVYAVFHDGMNHSGGPFLPGWPARPSAPFSTLLPLPFIAGAAASPAVLATGQETYVGIGTTGWFPQLIHYTDGNVTTETIPLLIHINAIGSPIFSSLLNNGDWQFTVPMTGAIRIDKTGFNVFNSSIMALGLPAPHDIMLQGNVEDIPMLAACAVADLDNNGIREVLAGTGGYLVHAFSAGGGEAPGWPKYTEKWSMAAPAAGDMDADGKLEVVVNTREGYLYAWKTEGEECPRGVPNSDWRRFHHDERNTGFYGADTLPPSRVVDLSAQWADATHLKLGFTAPGDDWNCGKAGSYEIRYSDRAAVDLKDPSQFVRATRVEESPLPADAGGIQSLIVNAPGARHLALRARDAAGNLSLISNDPFADGTVQGSGGEQGPEDHGGCGCAIVAQSRRLGMAQIVVSALLYLLPLAYLGFQRRRLYSAR